MMAKLTASGVQNKREPGRYGDGDGLWLEVATPQRRGMVPALHAERQGSHDGPGGC